jgi:hypothetical protein
MPGMSGIPGIVFVATSIQSCATGGLTTCAAGLVWAAESKAPTLADRTAIAVHNLRIFINDSECRGKAARENAERSQLERLYRAEQSICDYREHSGQGMKGSSR